MNKKKLESARAKLLQHVRLMSRRHQDEVSGWEGLVKHRLAGRTYCLPAYIPFIGSQFFAARVRIIAYALSQNIRADSDFAIRWAKDWHESNGAVALDRQNECFSQSGLAAMHPFDTGHLPILASFARYLSIGRSQNSIYTEIAATNLSKYSFRSPTDLTRDSESGLNRCCSWFTTKEVSVLHPHIVLAAGNQVSSILTTALANTPVKVIPVPFPSIRVINVHYRRRFRPTSRQVVQLKRMLSAEDLKRCVLPRDRTIAEVIERDAAYFWPVFERMKAQRSERGLPIAG